MRIQYILPFILFLVFALVLGSGLALAQSTYSNSDNGKTIAVNSGDTFTIKLDENPTTAYSWDMTVENGLQIVNDRYVASTPQMIGSGGYHEWTVKAMKNGIYKISGIYKRPWESATSTDKRFSMTVKVANSQSSNTVPAYTASPEFKYKSDLINFKPGNIFFAFMKFPLFKQ